MPILGWALTAQPPSAPPPVPQPDPTPDEEALIEVDRGASEHPQPGGPSGYTCPECHGALWESPTGALTAYRCRTGHAFSPESLVAAQSDHVERALWAALRALEEKAAMLRRMSARFTEREQTGVSARLERKANTVLEEALTLRKLLREIERPEDVFDAAAEA